VSLFVGIEAVGLRHCAVAASDEHGRVNYGARRVGEPIILHSTDRALIRQRLFNLLKDVCAGTGLMLDDLRDSTVCIGIAGTAFPSELSDLQEEFNRLEVQVGRLICRTDTDIVLASHLRSLDGSLITCGSGAAVLISQDGRLTRSGGWGPAVGETGSGYWIGRQAISAIAQECFKGSPLSELWTQIDKWLKAPSGSDYPELKQLRICWMEYLERHLSCARQADPRSLFLAFINRTSVEHHHAWRFMVSTLSQPVMAAAANGTNVAQHILDRGMKYLIDRYVECCEVANGGKPVSPIVLYGGVLNHHSDFRSRLQNKLRHKFGEELQFVTPCARGALRPACGALLLALGLSSEQANSLPPQEIIRNVEESVGRLESGLDGLKND
jgi:N-acetylglucosamine kinase-like BadF-type ATPase